VQNPWGLGFGKQIWESGQAVDWSQYCPMWGAPVEVPEVPPVVDFPPVLDPVPPPLVCPPVVPVRLEPVVPPVVPDVGQVQAEYVPSAKQVIMAFAHGGVASQSTDCPGTHIIWAPPVVPVAPVLDSDFEEPPLQAAAPSTAAVTIKLRIRHLPKTNA
jgi:hypothetical protein